MAHIASKKRWERLHKFAENIKKNDIVYMQGVPFVWGGFKHNKAKLHRMIYSNYTYTDAEILKLERYCK